MFPKDPPTSPYVLNNQSSVVHVQGLQQHSSAVSVPGQIHHCPEEMSQITTNLLGITDSNTGTIPAKVLWVPSHCQTNGRVNSQHEMKCLID